MRDPASAALAATRSIRVSTGYARLGPVEREALERDLQRIEHVLAGERPRGRAVADPYAVPFETPADLRGGLAPQGNGGAAPAPEPAEPAPAPPRPPGTEVIGGRARQALEAVDFPAFVAGLVKGTFQAVVDATSQQIRDYAQLVASLSQSVDEFSSRNVSPNQVRDWLVEEYPQDLMLVVPKPGERGAPQLQPRRTDGGEPPSWLERFGLGGEELTAELVEGPLLEAARRALAEERLQTLATMVLMGINRIVINDGEIKAKLQFHAAAREQVKAEMASQQGGIAARQITGQTAVTTAVSTVNMNAQADVAIKADLVGEVGLRFRSETFNLERFADSQAIQLITRRARTPEPSAVPAAPAAPVAQP